MNVAVTFGEFTASIVDGQGLIVNGVKHESLEEYLEWGEMVYCGSIEPSIVRIMEAMASQEPYIEGKLEAIAAICENRFGDAFQHLQWIEKAVDEDQEEWPDEVEGFDVENLTPEEEYFMDDEQEDGSNDEVMEDWEADLELFEMENQMDETVSSRP